MLCDRRIYHHVSCSQLFGFFPLGLCRRQPRNRQIHRQVCCNGHRISFGKERNIGFVGFLGLCRRQPRNRQIHRQVCWKRHRISLWKRAKHWFCWIPRKRWAKMVWEVPKMIVLWNFAAKSRLKASLAVWRNLLPYIFRGWLQPDSPSRRAAPGLNHCSQSIEIA